MWQVCVIFRIFIILTFNINIGFNKFNKILRIILFDDTVRANIAYANLKASDQQIREACAFAAADDFIEKLPQSYNTIIGENGIRLSGGQKQRLSIARAILKNAPIILLDEATSSLDADSESKVQNAIFNLTKNRTTLVIAHRLSTVMEADLIHVIDNGRLIESVIFFVKFMFGKVHEIPLEKSSFHYESW